MLRKFISIILIALLTKSAYAETSTKNTFNIIEANRTEATYNNSTQFVRDVQLDEYLNNIVKRILMHAPEASGFNFRIHAMHNIYPYVYCLDNGAVYISIGLLARLQNESQLAGLIAPEIASVVNQDKQSKNKLAQKQGEAIRVIPNLVLIAATVGLAAIPIIDKNNAEKEKLKKQLQLDADKVAIHWLQQAEFSPSEAPAAAQRLKKTLIEENRFSTSSVLANQEGLDERIKSLTEAMPAETNNPTTFDTNKQFLRYERRFALELANTDKKNSNAQNFNVVLNRTETELGVDGESSFLRAEFIRETISDDLHIPDAIQAYEKCTALADAPPEALRELGFLYRRLGNQAAAKRNFNLYLQRQPNAADAPIVRSYMENI